MLFCELTGCGPHFRIKVEFGVLFFCGERKTGEPTEKQLEQGPEPTTNSTNIYIYMTPGLGIERGPQWWEVSAQTTAPSLHPIQGS